jgi:hypothetical protein
MAEACGVAPTHCGKRRLVAAHARGNARWSKSRRRGSSNDRTTASFQEFLTERLTPRRLREPAAANVGLVPIEGSDALQRLRCDRPSLRDEAFVEAAAAGAPSRRRGSRRPSRRARDRDNHRSDKHDHRREQRHDASIPCKFSHDRPPLRTSP